jgi:uncharacterized protein (DUF1501 family)
MSQASRRAFLRQAAAYASLGAAGPVAFNLAALSKAAAAGTSGDDYRALVCIFMYGGNDAFNTVLATDSESWGHYVDHRDPKSRNPSDTSTSIALLPENTPADTTAAKGTPAYLGGVKGIAHSGLGANAGRTLALHPSLSDVAQLYQQGRVALLSNVGPLTAPLSKAAYDLPTASRPAKLYSHNDQQSTWQSFSPEGASAGWGGRMGDLLMSQNGQGIAAADQALIQRSFTCITPAASAVWLTGGSVMQYQVSNTGLISLGNGSRIFKDANLGTAVAAIMNPASSTNLFAQAQQELVDRALKANALLGAKLPASGLAPWGTAGQTSPYNDALLKYISPASGAEKFNSLALQLQMVARLIDANRAGGLNLKRQVFMVSMGGFDTHDNQNQNHADLMAQLNHALAYFDTVLGNMPGGNLRHQVTTFTASEFGRTFTNNGDGTDHGWGGHHFIAGGAIKGGDVYGSIPHYSTADAKGVFSSLDQLSNGVLLPSTSVDQMAYTLGHWMGVSDSNLQDIAPHLKQFNAATHNLGFMG